jgi:polyisoprenoid-binding protein YceI
MKLRLSPLVLSVAVALGAVGADLSAERRPTTQNAVLHAVSPPQAAENIDASEGRVSNKNEDSKGGVTTMPNVAKAEVEAPAVTRFRINAGQSHFTAHVSVGGLLSAFGHNHTISMSDLAGDVQLTPDTIEPASLRMTIKANSAAETGKGFSEKDRQQIARSVHEEALEAMKYPEILFNSTQISTTKTGGEQYQAKITGQLTLHGVTRPITIPAQAPLSGDALRARGEFPIRHSDYNIKRLSAGGGAVKAKDEMKLSFDVVANKY